MEIKKLISKYSALSILIPLLFSVILNCNKNENHQTLSKTNSVIIDGDEAWRKNINIHYSNCLDMKLRFWNNPFSLDSTYNIFVALENDVIIYKGKYKEYIHVCVPDSLLNKYLEPKLAIFKDNKSYYLINKTTLQIHNDDKFLYIVFMPDRGVVGGCMMFSHRQNLE